MRVAYFINPNAGVKNTSDIINYINKKNDNVNHEVFIWDNPHKADELINKIVEKQFDVIAAVGGDGTVNALASKLVQTNHTMAIVPTGSGNGLARHLHIPISYKFAIDGIKTFNRLSIDAGIMNKKYFFCTSGLGFDAHISNIFATSHTRGFIKYAQLTLKEISGYKPSSFSIVANDRTINQSAFIFTIGNASQFGNNAYITPSAIIDDGILEYTLIEKITPINFLPLIYKLFTRQIKSSNNVITGRSKSISIDTKSAVTIHLDGDPLQVEGPIKYSVLQKSLNILTPLKQ